MSERDRWDERHARGAPPGAPSPFVARHVATLATRTPRARALDLACGSGRHSELLADSGFRVVAVDLSRIAIAGLARRRPNVCGVVAYASALPFASASFDLVVKTRFLDRSIFADLIGLLRPGGVLIVETFLRAQFERTGHPRPEFCLEPGELRRLCSPAGLAVRVVEIAEGGPEATQERPAFASIAVERA